MEDIAVFKNVNYWYNRGQKRQVQSIFDASFSIKEGEFAAFFGPSGSGKTTLLHLLAGMESPQDGEVHVCGKDLSKLNRVAMSNFRQSDVGMVFQQFNLIPSFSARSNVMLPMAFMGLPKREQKTRADAILKRLNLSGLSFRFPGELSGGQQQRVGIARALANDPSLIIADEPLGNLDSENANNVLNLLKQLNQEDGKTVVMVTHEAWSLRDAKKIFLVRDGRIEQVEDRQDLGQSLTEHLLARLSPGKSEEGLQSSALAHLLFRGYSPEEVERFAGFLESRLAGKISEQEFREALDLPFQRGGVGLWRPKAFQISQQVEELTKKRSQIKILLMELEKNPAASLSTECANISNWIMKEYRGQLSFLQTGRIRNLVSLRIRGKLTPQKFREGLWTSRLNGGPGLSLRAANAASEKLESVLLGDSPHFYTDNGK
jgi:putative ABC transport system ATP-binding protein